MPSLVGWEKRSRGDPKDPMVLSPNLGFQSTIVLLLTNFLNVQDSRRQQMSISETTHQTMPNTFKYMGYIMIYITT